MHEPTNELSAQDQEVLGKLLEARELYDNYLELVSIAQQATPASLTEWPWQQEPPDVHCEPQPLTITFGPPRQ